MKTGKQLKLDQIEYSKFVNGEKSISRTISLIVVCIFFLGGAVFGMTKSYEILTVANFLGRKIVNGGIIILEAIFSAIASIVAITSIQSVQNYYRCKQAQIEPLLKKQEDQTLSEISPPLYKKGQENGLNLVMPTDTIASEKPVDTQKLGKNISGELMDAEEPNQGDSRKLAIKYGQGRE